MIIPDHVVAAVEAMPDLSLLDACPLQLEAMSVAVFASPLFSMESVDLNLLKVEQPIRVEIQLGSLSSISLAVFFLQLWVHLLTRLMTAWNFSRFNVIQMRISMIPSTVQLLSTSKCMMRP